MGSATPTALQDQSPATLQLVLIATHPALHALSTQANVLLALPAAATFSTSNA